MHLPFHIICFEERGGHLECVCVMSDFLKGVMAIVFVLCSFSSTEKIRKPGLITAIYESYDI
jgi:hypothetical protein